MLDKIILVLSNRNPPFFSLMYKISICDGIHTGIGVCAGVQKMTSGHYYSLSFLTLLNTVIFILRQVLSHSGARGSHQHYVSITLSHGS